LAGVRVDAPLREKTVRHYQAVRQFFIWAHAEGEIPVNPTQGIKQPAIQEKLIEVPTAEDIKVLLSKTAKNFEGLRDTAIIMMLMDCGLRASELIGLKLDDVDQFNNLLVVLGKGRRMREVPFGRGAARRGLAKTSVTPTHWPVFAPYDVGRREY